MNDKTDHDEAGEHAEKPKTIPLDEALERAKKIMEKYDGAMKEMDDDDYY